MEQDLMQTQTGGEGNTIQLQDANAQTPEQFDVKINPIEGEPNKPVAQQATVPTEQEAMAQQAAMAQGPIVEEPQQPVAQEEIPQTPAVEEGNQLIKEEQNDNFDTTYSEPLNIVEDDAEELGSAVVPMSDEEVEMPVVLSADPNNPDVLIEQPSVKPIKDEYKNTAVKINAQGRVEVKPKVTKAETPAPAPKAEPKKGLQGDGVYTYGDNKDLYKYKGGAWYRDAGGKGKYIKLNENVAKRTAELNKNAVKMQDNKSDVVNIANSIIQQRAGNVTDFRQGNLVTAGGNVATTQGLAFNQLTKSNVPGKDEMYTQNGYRNFNYDPNYANATPQAKALIDASTKSKPDGVYTYADRPGVLYKKQDKTWYVDNTGKGKSYQVLTQNVAEREAALEANAVPTGKNLVNSIAMSKGPQFKTDKDGKVTLDKVATLQAASGLKQNTVELKPELSKSFEEAQNFVDKDIMYIFGKDNVLSPTQREDIIIKQREIQKILGDGQYSDLKAASVKKILDDTQEYFNTAKEINTQINEAYSKDMSLDRYTLEEKRKDYMNKLNLENNTDFQKYAGETFESTLKMADFIQDGIEDGKLLYDRENGGYKFSTNITPTERKYYEGQLSKMITEYNDVQDERFASVNSEIQDSKSQLRNNIAREASINDELLSVEYKGERFKELYQEKYALKLERQQLEKDIDNKESLKSTVFLTEPKKLAASLNATNSAKNIFNAIPKEISPKQKFDIFYKKLSEKNEQLAQQNGIDTGRLGELSRGFKDMLDWGGYFSLSDAEKEYVNNLGTLNKMAPLYYNNDFGFTQSSGGFFESFMNGAGNLLQPVTGEASGYFSQSKVANDVQQILEDEGFGKDDIVDDNYVNALKDKANTEFWSAEQWGNMLGTTAAIMAPLILTKKVPTTALRVAGRVENLVAKTKNAETAALYLKRAEDVFDSTLKSTKYGKYLVSPIKTGVEFEATGRVFGSTQDEMYFASGLVGGLASEGFAALMAKLPTDKAYSYVEKIFGANTEKAVNVLKKIGEANVKGLSETAEEFGNEFTNIYTDELRDKGFFAEVAEKFGTLDQVQEFVISTYIMGVGFGIVDSDKQRAAYESLPAEKKKQVDEILDAVRDDINVAESKVDNYAEAQTEQNEKKAKVEKEPEVEVKETETGGIDFDVANIEKASEGTPSTVDEARENPSSFTEPIDILELEKYDKENEQGVPGEVGEGQEPKQAEPVAETSQEETSPSGVVQEEQVQGEKLDTEKDKGKRPRTTKIAGAKEVADEKRESNLKGVKYSDIVVGGKFLDKILDENNLSEEDKKIIKEQLFDRSIEYFDFNKDSEAKWQLSAANPEDINDISDALTGLSAAEFSAYDSYSQGNYKNIKPALEYIIEFSEKGEYSDAVINTAKEIRKLAENAKSSDQIVYAINSDKILDDLGVGKAKPTPSNPFEEIEATKSLKGTAKTNAIKEIKQKYGADYNRISKIDTNFASIVRDLEKNNLIEKDCG